MNDDAEFCVVVVFVVTVEIEEAQANKICGRQSGVSFMRGIKRVRQELCVEPV